MILIKQKKKYVNNEIPNFIPKINYLQKNKFILSMIKLSKIIDVSESLVNFTTLPIDPKTGKVLPRSRKLNKHRILAMQSIVQGMLYYFNVNTKKVQISLGTLADECGLSTISSSGNKSITRASRLISEFMEPMGFVKCKKIKKKKSYLKEISLTPLFFLLFEPLTLSDIDHKKKIIRTLKYKNVKSKLSNKQPL